MSNADAEAVALERVRIANFRCLAEVEAALAPGQNFVYGPNAAGKTSFLEALFLLSRGRSFRTRESRRLVRRGATDLVVFGELAGCGGIMRRLGVRFGPAGRDISVDGCNVQTAVALAEVVQADIIDPSVYRLVEGGPSERRRFLDWGVFHVEHGFLDGWRRYRRVLGQRNALLKRGSSIGASHEAFNAAFVAAGMEVTQARHRFAELLAVRLEATSRYLLGTPVKVEYWEGWRRGLSLEAALMRSMERDEQAGFTQVGPHRADLRLTFDGGSLQDAASRGQQKLAAAALILANVQVLRDEASGTAARLLLVDDPAAELDTNALGRLMDVIGETGAQTVITGLSRTQLIPSANAAVFHVEQGKVEQLV